MSTLVFLEHHGSAIQKGSLGVLTKAVSLDPETAAVLIGSGVGPLAEQAGRYGAKTVFVADSEPEREHAEILAKAAAMAGALGVAS